MWEIASQQRPYEGVAPDAIERCDSTCQSYQQRLITLFPGAYLLARERTQCQIARNCIWT